MASILATPTSPEPAKADFNPFSLKHYPPGTRKIANFGLVLFLVGLAVAGFWEPNHWPLSVLLGGAFMAIGWAIGFIFGVPRTASIDKTSNTNLEQISDWLTKVLVGVGLTQLQQIPAKLGVLTDYISRAYNSNDHTSSESNVFALAMVLYFFALGFLTGYLLTRLALQPDFSSVDAGDGAPTDAEALITNSEPSSTTIVAPAAITPTPPPAATTTVTAPPVPPAVTIPASPDITPAPPPEGTTPS